jgi:hypothetical protein
MTSRTISRLISSAGVSHSQVATRGMSSAPSLRIEVAVLRDPQVAEPRQGESRLVGRGCGGAGGVDQREDWRPEAGGQPEQPGRGPASGRTAAAGSLQLADGPPKEPVRVHLDLYTGEQARHVERLVTLGATRVDEWPYPDGADFIVMRDPDGNEACVIDHPER